MLQITFFWPKDESNNCCSCVLLLKTKNMGLFFFFYLQPNSRWNRQILSCSVLQDASDGVFLFQRSALILFLDAARSCLSQLTSFWDPLSVVKAALSKTVVGGGAKTKKPPLGLDSRRCCPKTVGETLPPSLCLCFIPWLQVSTLAIIVFLNIDLQIPLTIPGLLIMPGALWDNVRARPLWRRMVTRLCCSFHSAWCEKSPGGESVRARVCGSKTRQRDIRLSDEELAVKIRREKLFRKHDTQQE